MLYKGMRQPMLPHCTRRSMQLHAPAQIALHALHGPPSVPSSLNLAMVAISYLA